MIFNQSPQVVALEADIIFDTNGLMTSSFSHAPGTSQIVITTTGTYFVQFTVSGVEPNQFAVFLNGTPVNGSVFGSGAGTQNNVGQVLMAASAGDVITLRNHTSAAAVTLQILAGGTQFNVNASVMIQRLE